MTIATAVLAGAGRVGPDERTDGRRLKPTAATAVVVVNVYKDVYGRTPVRTYCCNSRRHRECV